jgi:hypothetical protein
VRVRVIKQLPRHSGKRVELMLWLTVSRPIRLGVRHPFGTRDQIFLFPFFCRTTPLFFVLRCPLWREDGSVICRAICQWSESRRTHNHTLLSHLRLLGSLSVASYDSEGFRWKYSNPPPHGEGMSVLKKSKPYPFHDDWEIEYFFVTVKDKCCLICKTSVSLPKQGNLEHHYNALYSNNANFPPQKWNS